MWWRLALPVVLAVLTGARPGQTTDVGWLHDVALSATSFNPSQGERVDLRYRLARRARVTVKIYDADLSLVARLAPDGALDPGEHTVAWDGRDLDGRTVPNEAYAFVIRAVTPDGATAIHDPLAGPPAEAADASDTQFDREAGTLSYRLPAPGRVLVRLGVHSGPLLRTLVDWEARLGGVVTEYWDGKDAAGLVDLRRLSEFASIVAYVPLPATTVITIGNAADSWPARRAGAGRRRVQRLGGEMLPVMSRRSPRVRLTFGGADPGASTEVIPVGPTPLTRVEVVSEDQGLLVGQAFEIAFFVDHVFLVEQEEGYVPFTLPLDLSRVPPGEHLVTVNVSTVKGGVGVVSRKVRVRQKGES